MTVVKVEKRTAQKENQPVSGYQFMHTNQLFHFNGWWSLETEKNTFCSLCIWISLLFFVKYYIV